VNWPRIIKDLREQVKSFKQSFELTFDDHEQYSRRNNIRISGVKETKDENKMMKLLLKFDQQQAQTLH
jgi:hypothetical protein